MGNRRGTYRALVRKPEERDHLKDPGIDGRIILKWIFEKWEGGMDQIRLAEDMDRWWADVNAVMNLRVT
jgi:hypothetical protein